jgi:O-antigen/teichoic acid export membrane protein
MLIVGGTILSGPPLALLVAAQQVRNILTAPLTLFNGAAPKLMIHAYRDGDSEELQSIVRLGSSFATVIVICLAPPFLLVGNFIFTLLFGQLYADSAYYFALLIPGLLAFAVGGSGGRMMVLLGRQKEFMVYSACIAGLSIPMLAWSASNYGASGISIATSVLLVLQNAILVLLVRRYFGIWSHAYLAPQRYFELGRSALALIRRKLGKAGGKGKSQK